MLLVRLWIRPLIACAAPIIATSFFKKKNALYFILLSYMAHVCTIWPIQHVIVISSHMNIQVYLPWLHWSTIRRKRSVGDCRKPKQYPQFCAPSQNVAVNDSPLPEGAPSPCRSWDKSNPFLGPFLHWALVSPSPGIGNNPVHLNRHRDKGMATISLIQSRAVVTGKLKKAVVLARQSMGVGYLPSPWTVTSNSFSPWSSEKTL